MKRKRTRYFKLSLKAVSLFGIAFLLFLLTFGKQIALSHFEGMAGLTFSILALSLISLFVFVYIPFFRGDKRWYAISGILSTIFFFGASILWTIPVGGI